MLVKGVITLNIFCSRFTFINWLQNHLLRCPFKYLTGIDCPGCGFQRSVLALMQGNLLQSFKLYPAAIPLLLFFAYGIADKFLKLDNTSSIVKKSIFIITGSIILISYSIKICELYLHYKASA
jgi:hypothetical protein